MDDAALLKDIVHKILDSNGPWAALLVLVGLWHLHYVEGQARGRLEDKDREIERLVKDRNQLQEMVLSKRKSSGVS